ncbi:glycosyltransferase family 4 protein [Microbulbifer taiwanensis]|uniref:glycosyltransferase family 4 protein n=1 Tax=Microbulbifer taiwanensis TaxID=986746 RepID=UPI003618BA7F
MKRSLKTQVFSIGYVEDLANLHEFTRVTVLPDIAGEGIPIKTNEVLALGCPFVATVHALRAFTAEELELSGITAASAPQEMAEQIQVLLERQQIWKEVGPAIQRLVGCYSMNDYLRNWECLLKGSPTAISPQEDNLNSERQLNSVS